MFQLIALGVAYALADRFAGGGWPALDAKLPGRAAFWGALAASLVGFLIFGGVGALLGLAWLIYRTPGWKVFGGALNPANKEILGTFLRHAIAAPAVALVAYWGGGNPALAAMGMIAYAAIATALARWYATQLEEGKDPGVYTYVELARGLMFGLLAGVAIL